LERECDANSSEILFCESNKEKNVVLLREEKNNSKNESLEVNPIVQTWPKCYPAIFYVIYHSLLNQIWTKTVHNLVEKYQKEHICFLLRRNCSFKSLKSVLLNVATQVKKYFSNFALDQKCPATSPLYLIVCHWFIKTNRGDYFWVNFNHYRIGNCFMRQLGQ